MTIYDLLRRLLPGAAWQEYELAEARELIAELERLSVFGTAGSRVAEQHEHVWQTLVLPAPNSTSYYQRGWKPEPPIRVERCAICGKDKQ